jgi:UDPglucose 6-dehydrogenase
MKDAEALLTSSVKFCDNAYDALKGADAGVLITEWNQFRSLDLKTIRGNMKQPVFFDLRNVYEPAVMRGLGFTYYCVGRK